MDEVPLGGLGGSNHWRQRPPSTSVAVTGWLGKADKGMSGRGGSIGASVEKAVDAAGGGRPGGSRKAWRVVDIGDPRDDDGCGERQPQ